jgi:hypothetical protein
MTLTGEIYAGQIEANSEITSLVGIFVARWSLAEHSLMLAFLAATGSRRQELATTILSATASTEAKIRIVHKLLGVSAMPDERRKAIRKAVKELERLCQDRNAIMHHLWGRRDNDEIITIDYREPDTAKSQSVRTVTSLKTLCNAVVDAAHAISQATRSIWIDKEAASKLKV